MCNKKKILVLGAGSFGTALAVTLCLKGHDVAIWGRLKAQMELMAETLENPHYLPGVKLPEELKMVYQYEDVIGEADVILFSVPAQSFRSVFEEVKEFLNKEAIIVNVAKGIEKESLMRLSQVAEEIMPGVNYVALSGPSHAEEVARLLHTTVVASYKEESLAKAVQNIFNTDRFRVYTNDDIAGVELGGALKNIIALGAGISDGMGFGDNSKAAIITRGVSEICRLGVSMGAKQETFTGLTGIGDLVVTCTSMHSRNRKCGLLIGQGVLPEQATEEVGMVVEGISTTEAAYLLAQKMDIEMPITECIYNVIKGNIPVAQAVNVLMGRDLKRER